MNQLMMAVAANPADPDRWDALVEQLVLENAPRGRLARASDPAPLLRELGPLWTGQDGVVQGNQLALTPPRAEPSEDSHSAVLTFEQGHLHTLSVRLCVPQDQTEGEVSWLCDLLNRILTQPVGQLVQTIEVLQGSDYQGDFGAVPIAVYEAISNAAPVALRTLVLGHNDLLQDDEIYEGSSFVEVPSPIELLQNAPNVQSLTLLGACEAIDLSGPLAALRSLRLLSNSEEVVEAFEDCNLPELQHLTLWLVDPEDECPEVESCDDLAPIWRANLPSLRSLVLHARDLEGDLVGALSESRWFTRLESIEVHGLTTEKTEALVEAARPHNVHVDVSRIR